MTELIIITAAAVGCYIGMRETRALTRWRPKPPGYKHHHRPPPQKR